MTEQSRISVSLPLEQWNVVGAGLAELPFRVAAPVIGELQRQVSAGLEAAKASGEAAAGAGP